MKIEIDEKFIFMENDCLIHPDMKQNIDEKIKKSYMKKS